jgi:aspartate racemase
MREGREAPCLGMIGGLGVGATVHYYRSLVQAHAAHGLIARLLIAHANLDDVRTRVEAGDIDGLAGYLARHIAQLAAGGAQIAVVSAVTPHICAPKLAAISPLPLVDIIDALNLELQSRRLLRVALFGTRFAMETRLFGRLAGVELAAPTAAETDFVHAAYMRIASTGVGAHYDVEALRGIAQRLCEEEGAEAVVLAGTDLSIVFDERAAGFPAIDASRVHVDAVMRRLLAPSA